MIVRRSEPAVSSIFHRAFKILKLPFEHLESRMNFSLAPPPYVPLWIWLKFPEPGRRHRRLVGSSGLEPPTSRLSGARSNQLSYEPICQDRSSNRPRNRRHPRGLSPLSSFRSAEPGTRTARGGDDGIRTHDPLLAGQVLSQLSYTPVCLYPSS